MLSCGQKWLRSSRVLEPPARTCLNRHMEISDMAIEAVSSTTAALNPKQATAAILKLINSRPTSPRQDEIEAIIVRAVLATESPLSDDQAGLLEAIHEFDAAQRALENAGDDDEDEEARFTAAERRVGELAERLPTPTRSFTEIVLLTQVAHCYACRDDEADPDQIAAARLIQAIHEFAGIQYE
jgi:hypothetical protein